MGYAAYFLIVADFIRYAREQGIATTCRGSAPGSVVTYTLRITPVDPISYELPFERFLNPDRDIDAGAERIHGISSEDLENQPRFHEIVDEFLKYVAGAELIIHNAEFDVGFIEHELTLMKHPQPEITAHATVLDTLSLARKMHPGQRNSLDALCKRYEVDASKRDVHGALIDSELLARVYLAMTGGQTALSLDADVAAPVASVGGRSRQAESGQANDLNLVVIRATDEEAAAHEAILEKIARIGHSPD